MQFLTFNFFANTEILYIYNVHNYPFYLRSARHSIFLQIYKFRTYNIHNFSLNFRSCEYSIFLQIQTFRTDIMYTMSRRIFAVWTVNCLQIQTFRTYNVHNFPLNLCCYGFQFFFKSKHSVRILY